MSSNYFKKLWNFLWNEDSMLSWTVNILLAFIIIKFLVYPGLGMLFGTNLPVVAVISESMEHNGDFDKWWNSNASCNDDNIISINYVSCSQREWYEKKGITKDKFLNFPMHNGFNKGDIIILRGANYDTIEIGDIIVFNSLLPYPIIHRVVNKNDVISTKGDHNPRQIVDIKINEKYITKNQIIGKAWIKIPYLGYVKIWFTEGINAVAKFFVGVAK